jgi:formamidopyrimidine-DNA glycosylase
MPELPEVEITARRLNEALAGARIASATAPGVNTLKTFDPPLGELAGARVEGVSRRGKHLIVRTDSGLAMLIHLMSAGRLQLYGEPRENPASGGGNGSSPRARPTARRRAGATRDRTLRLLVRVEDGRELRLREFGSKQATWVKVLRTEELEADPALAGLGPEAWPDPPPLEELLEEPRPLHAALRDQHVITGIGRSWVDEILWEARLSPYKRGSDLEEDEAERLRAAIVSTLGAALDHYEQVICLPIPDKLPMPLRVHRHEGEPCPRCDTPLASVHFEDYVIAYCPMCQTGGKVLKDRRLSRLLR